MTQSGQGILIIGALQLAAACYFLPRRAFRPTTWARKYRYPGRWSDPRCGATLASAVVAMFIIALCLTMVLQGYVQGRRVRLVQQQRTTALAVCQEQVEKMRAGGYHRLPNPGKHSFAVPAQAGLEGSVQVTAGPAPASRSVTVTARWPDDGQTPAGHLSLSTVVSARGVGG